MDTENNEFYLIDLCQESRGHPERPKITSPEGRMKVRNSCVFGVGHDESKCLLCRRARFYTIVSGHYNDMPSTTAVMNFVNSPITGDIRGDYMFALEYLGLNKMRTFSNDLKILEVVLKLIDVTYVILGDEKDASGIELVEIRHPVSLEMVSVVKNVNDIYTNLSYRQVENTTRKKE